MPSTVSDLISLFDLAQSAEWSFAGPQPDTLFQRLFGGQVMGQSLVAAMRTVETDRLVHSLHGYFLRPGHPDEPLRFEVQPLRDGRSFSTRRIQTWQGERLIFGATASFHGEEPGLSHSAQQPERVSPPEQSPRLHDIFKRRFGWDSPIAAEWDALDVRLASDAQPGSDGGGMRAWIRTQSEMPDDPQLHAAVLAYLSDTTLLSVSTVPHEVEFMAPKVQAASIDHAMWFHRPVRVDDWLLYDMVSPSASGARGFCTGRLFQNGEAVASCAQEGLIRLVDED